MKGLSPFPRSFQDALHGVHPGVPLNEIEIAIELWIQAAQNMGRPLPVPNPPALSI